MAEWLRSGLQIRARRFDSGSGLQNLSQEGVKTCLKRLFLRSFTATRERSQAPSGSVRKHPTLENAAVGEGRICKLQLG